MLLFAVIAVIFFISVWIRRDEKLEQEGGSIQGMLPCLSHIKKKNIQVFTHVALKTNSFVMLKTISIDLSFVYFNFLIRTSIANSWQNFSARSSKKFGRRRKRSAPH
jgi:hypothetical protein